jgi:hypothetical protein
MSDRVQKMKDAQVKKHGVAPPRPPAVKPPPHNVRKPVPPRLPDNSQFQAFYMAGDQTWTGTLVVPGIPPFATSARALFTLFSKLDTKYRQYLLAQEKKNAAGPE